MTVSGVVAWFSANKAQLLILLAAVVASASLIIKALEAVVAALLVFFPKLKDADGKLLAVAAWFDALSKASWLNSLALSPKAAKKVLVLLLMGLVFHVAPAEAQVLVSSGPTLPLVEVRPGNPHPVNLAAGAGYQLSLTAPAFQQAVAGRAWDFLDFEVMAFGTAVSSTAGNTFGAFSGAVGVCTLSSFLCVGVGHDIVTSPGLKPGWFGVFAISINFASAPKSPPVGTEKGTLGLPRGNHLYWGAF